jgi:hypothetical protein
MPDAEEINARVFPGTPSTTAHGFEERGLKVPLGTFNANGRFGRMLPSLMPLTSFKPGPVILGEVAGAMDGGSPAPTDPTQDNPRIRAGYTFLGQFIDHDLTFDAVSILERQIDLNATHNFRTPAFELDSVYGLGPSLQPYLYQANGMHFQLSPDGTDLQRNVNERALIGDPRNDENLIISRLHLLILKFHNAVVDKVTDPTLGAFERFLRAQQMVRWHYQWLVLHEFLVRIVGRATVERVLTLKPFTFSHDAFMPIEFSAAAYRFGHSQVRPGYLLNTDGGLVQAGLTFPDPAIPGSPDLRGFRKQDPARRVDWSLFFGPASPGVPAGGAQASKRIDTRLSTAMLRLPDGVVPASTPAIHRSIATRNLQRGLDAQLPSGQDVAAMLIDAEQRLTEAEIWGANDIGTSVSGGEGAAPLWFYVLREAEVKTGGLMLAGAGAEIVARTMIALLAADPASQINRDPHWKPSLGTHEEFTATDLVNFAEGTSIPGEDVDRLPGS